MRNLIDILEQHLREAKSGDKVTRDAFLYMAPEPPAKSFAQCATCIMLVPSKTVCAIHGPDLNVEGGSCGLYVHGKPNDNQKPVKRVTPEESGFVKRQVRCENCLYLNGDTCGLYESLNKALPDTFNLDTKVDPHGCCNAQQPASEK